MRGSLSQIVELVISFVILLFSLCFHEAAHAWAAFKLGDPTAYRQGRLTLNPRAHIDPVLTLLMPLLFFVSSVMQGMGFAFVFGLAKPVPINPYLFRNIDRDLMLSALAGPASNLLIAVIASLLYLPFGGLIVRERFLDIFLLQTIVINVCLLTFNLIPIPPLDGSRLLRRFLPFEVREKYDQLEPYGLFILLIVLNVTPLLALMEPFRWYIIETLLVFRPV